MRVSAKTKQLQAELDAALRKIEGLECAVKELREQRDSFSDALLSINGLK